MNASTLEQIAIVAGRGAGMLALKLHSPKPAITLVLLCLIILGGVAGIFASSQKEREHKTERTEDKTSMGDLKNMTGDILLIVSGSEKGDFDKEFPLGYSILAVSGQRTFVPYESPLRGDYVVRWETAKITNLTESDFDVFCPDLQNVRNNQVLTGVAVGPIERKVGPRVPATRMGNVGVYAKVLANTKTGVLVLVGLREVQN
jgi:hypothetical protein